MNLIDPPLVSIVMAAYNEEKYIKETIDSILNQTYENFEFIIINDGSTDRTEEIILSFSDCRIKYVKNEQNLNLIASLNKGMSMATGKYIARMDADDISLSERLEKQVGFMEENLDIGISGAQLIVFGTEDSTMNYPLEHEDLQLRLLITSCFANNLVIFRRELMQQKKLFFLEGYDYAEDYKYWTQWLQLARGANLPDYLVKYRFHLSSVSQRFKKEQRMTRLRVRIEYLGELFRLKNSEVAADLYGTNYRKKLKALKFILQENNEIELFDQEKLRRTLFYLWYMDSLEQTECDRTTIYKFTWIFSVSFSQNIRYWEYIIKHAIKSFLRLLPKTV